MPRVFVGAMNADEGLYSAEMHSKSDKRRGIRLELVMVAFDTENEYFMAKNETSCRQPRQRTFFSA